MVGPNSNAIRRSRRISSGLKNIKKSTPVTADRKLHKLLDMDAKQECMRNSKDDVSQELEQKLKCNATASFIESQLGENMIDTCKTDDTFVEKPWPSIDLNAMAGEEDDIQNQMYEETHAQLKAKIKELQTENSKNCRKIREISESCLQITEENCRLMKKLKRRCTPETIAYLKAQNPEKKSGGSLL